MSGVTRRLTPDQERELRRYLDGSARKPAARPNKNLLRRGLLAAVGYGEGYRITPFGRDVLMDDGHKPSSPKPTAPVAEDKQP